MTPLLAVTETVTTQHYNSLQVDTVHLLKRGQLLQGSTFTTLLAEHAMFSVGCHVWKLEKFGDELWRLKHFIKIAAAGVI